MNSVVDIRETEESSVFSGDMWIPRYIARDGFAIKYIIDDFSKRLNIVEFRGQIEPLTLCLLNLAEEHDLTKVVIKAQEDNWDSFITFGYVLEGILKYFYNGAPAFCMAKFLSPERRFSHDIDDEDRLIERLIRDETPQVPGSLAPGITLRPASTADAAELAELYNRVFESYPTPLNKSGYIEHLMESGSLFRVATMEGEIVSAASGAVNLTLGNAEMTDCATHPKARGMGLMATLLFDLERELARSGITCLWATARAPSVGVNVVLCRLGYRYQGRQINNCHIMGHLEDMNLWVKTM